MEWSRKLCLFLSLNCMLSLSLSLAQIVVAGFGKAGPRLKFSSEIKPTKFLANMFMVRPLSYDTDFTLSLPSQFGRMLFFLLLLSVSPSLPSDRNIFGASAKTKFCAKIVWTIKKWHHKWFAVNVILKKGILTYYMTLVGEQQHCVCLVVCRTNEKKGFYSESERWRQIYCWLN